eukprot:5791473-Prymnesium_polylepis.1
MRACVRAACVRVGSEQHERVIIASDGLWDFCTPELAAAIVRRAPTAKKAAREMVRLAELRSKAKFNEIKDDTTC